MAEHPEPVRTIAGAAELGVVVDLDGTAIPFAATPEAAHIEDATRALLEGLAAAPRTHVVIASGRPRADLDSMLAGLRGVGACAEHGAWRRAAGAAEWTPVPLEGTPPSEIASRLCVLASAHRGALVEQKTWAAALHYRAVEDPEREALVVEATDAIDAWTREHPEYELLEGSLVVEVRHRGANKGTAIEWVRTLVPPGTPLLALGDDLTDEDGFAALRDGDVGILVGADRPTLAKARLESVAAVHALLGWLARARSRPEGEPQGAPRPFVRSVGSKGERANLLVVSNRLPDDAPRGGESDRARNVGGLVSGLVPALAARGGTWLGWSGARRAGRPVLAIDGTSRPARASFDLPPEWHALFYNGFANGSLWPIFHSFPGRARYAEAEWRAYEAVNGAFADHAARLVAPGGIVWAHDYHLLLLAKALRARGHWGPTGLFLHIPFPPVDLFETIPWANELIEGLLAFDLVGVHTRRYAESFVRCAETLGGAIACESGVRVGRRTVRVGVFPLGIDAAAFEPRDDGGGGEIAELAEALRGRKLVLGVDRLDYTKGIVERLAAFGRMLELFPEWRGKVSMVQVAVPSRADVPEYAEQRRAIETAVGRINGEHGEAHWVPVRYVYRSYGRAQLARLYRAAHVGYVTPLRDGMNLVAKEYVAAQDAADPGVLLLSRFAGAAEELHRALLTNPYDTCGMARDLARALAMDRRERIERHHALSAAVRRSPPEAWAARVLGELEAIGRPANLRVASEGAER
jgi:trehalose 6-phosphate synthase